MCVGEILALVQGLATPPSHHRIMVPPDNRCCFCLTLRSGSLVIGIGNCLFYIACFLCYLTSHSFGAPISESLTFTNLDISVFVIFLIQLVVNLLLIVGALRRLPSHIFPWICANAVFCGICMIGIVVTIFWGTTKLGLNHSDYVSVLSVLGLVTGINLFCVIVVFQFRHNTLLEERIALETGVEVTLPCGSAPPLPPPSYDEVARTDLKLPLEDGPPEYEAAVAMPMLRGGEKVKKDEDKSPVVQRKKSLTSHLV